MKLLTQTGLYYFMLSLLVMVLGAALFYKSLIKYVDSSSTEELLVMQQKITTELSTIDSIPHNNWLPNHQIQFTRIAPNLYVRPQVSDTDFINLSNGLKEPYRLLSFNAHSRYYNYAITVAQSQVAGDDLVEVVIKSMFVMISLLFILLFVINQTISRQIWKPFYYSLQQLRQFDVQQSNQLHTQPTGISEFNELNLTLQQMTTRIQSDYNNLKEFTENASHEIQTPLAIIRSKIELLLQSENLTENQWKQLSQINEAADRLSRLNQSLLLLAKIENGQFTAHQKVNLNAALQKHIDNLHEIIVDRNITLQQNLQEEVWVTIHPHLLDILLSNLLTNAIRHNIENGYLQITLSNTNITFKNPGKELTQPTTQLFNRFKKANSEGATTGLGLSIIQKIVSANGWQITYLHQQHTHTLIVFF